MQCNKGESNVLRPGKVLDRARNADGDGAIAAERERARSVSWHAVTPQETAISSNGFIDIFTFALSTPNQSAFTRTLTLSSTTRLRATTIFIRASLRAPHSPPRR